MSEYVLGVVVAVVVAAQGLLAPQGRRVERAEVQEPESVILGLLLAFQILLLSPLVQVERAVRRKESLARVTTEPQEEILLLALT